MKILIYFVFILLILLSFGLQNSTVFSKEIPLDSLQNYMNTEIIVTKVNGNSYQGQLIELGKKYLKLINNQDRKYTIKLKDISDVFVDSSGNFGSNIQLSDSKYTLPRKKRINADSLIPLLDKQVTVLTNDSISYYGMLLEIYDNLITLYDNNLNIKGIEFINILKIEERALSTTSLKKELSSSEKAKKDSLLYLAKKEMQSYEDNKYMAKQLLYPGLIMVGIGFATYNYYYQHNDKNQNIQEAGISLFTGIVGIGFCIGAYMYNYIAGESKEMSFHYRYEASKLNYSLYPEYKSTNRSLGLNFQIKF